MPPRYVYWTIIIDGKATAFRARERDELLPTFNQLARKNRDIAMRYFARGKLWDTPEQAEWAAKRLPAPRETRNRDWRPGGAHEDPRARFNKTSASFSRDSRPDNTRRPTSRPAADRPPGDRRPTSRPAPRPTSWPTRGSTTKPASRPPSPRDEKPAGSAGPPTASPARKSWSAGKSRKPK